jgi:two-component system, sensor histidine kinase and response regulator
MTWEIVVSALPIALGALIMTISIMRFSRIFTTAQQLPDKNRSGLLQFLNIHRLLMGFFLLAYALVLAGIILQIQFVSHLFVSAIFLFIAIFVYISIVLEERFLSGILDKAAESLKIHKHMTDAAKDALVLLDDEGRIEYCNRATTVILGYSPEDILGKTPCETFINRPLGKKMPTGGKYFHCFTENSGSDTFEFNAIHRDGHTIPVELTASGFKTGEMFKELGALRDISPRRQAETQLLKAKEMAESANRAKSEFLANMSHEIRTPMNGIIGMTELTLETELGMVQREYLEMVKTSSDALLSLINDILDFSKVEAGMLEIESIDFQLRNNLGNTLNTLALRAHQKGLELAYDIPPVIVDALVGDPGRVRQVITNLVGNAIKFTKQGEVIVYVTEDSHDDISTVVHFAVKDTGIGISEDNLASIFESFTQADGSITRRYGGTGLGLAISKRLVELMGGNIWVESKEGVGSTFHFTARFEIQKDSPPPSQQIKPAELQDLPVLIVDDNATNRRILTEMLTNWGMRPYAVETGPLALISMERAIHADQPIPLALIDGNMPEMDGFTLAEHIGNTPRFSTTKLMMLTSAGRRGDAARCKELGISGYLMKPVKQSDLFDAMITILGQKDIERQQAALVTRHSIRESEPKYSILLAEDNPVNQKVATRILEKRGHFVTLAENGMEVLKQLENRNFDVILMDIQMPEMDGLEATRTIRTREAEEGGHLPIIAAMTAHAMKGDKERCLAAGMDEYVPKPIKPILLFNTLRDVLDGKKPIPRPSAGPAANHSKPSPPLSGLDKEAILVNLEGDNELLAELIEMYQEDSPKLLDAIAKAVGDKDAQAVQRAAHALKGAIGNFGQGRAYEAAQTLEKLGRTDDLENVAGVHSVLLEAVNELIADLKKL